MQGSENYSFNLGISEFQSQTSDELKHCGAKGGENATPISIMDRTVSPVGLAAFDTPTTSSGKDEVKRNLVEVYDVR
ncbi:hypothetical protein Hanom_Chr13g01205411 [Helianthus anomalus]